jgi:hypothetical protein
MTNVFPELIDLGDEIERAVAAEIAAARRARRQTRKKLLLAAAALAIAIPGFAIAANALISGDEVAAGLPAGTRMLQGTDPRCTVVRQDVEYRCVLTRLPAEPEVSDLKGTVEPTVDASKHVNGGCRSLTSDGRTWQCYIVRAAVEQHFISTDFLGEYAPTQCLG